jgi:hypothetical protein
MGMVGGLTEDTVFLKGNLAVSLKMRFTLFFIEKNIEIMNIEVTKFTVSIV